MNRLFAFVLAAVLAAVLPLASGLRAQVPLTPVNQQELAQRKFAELTESMQQLQAYLAKIGEQDDIKVVRAGLLLVQEKRIAEAMDGIKVMLEHEKWDDALTRMKTVREDLVLLLKVLQERATDLQELLERIAFLQGLRNEVDKLAKEQGKEKDDSARTEELQQQLEAIEKAKAAAERLLAEQQQLRDTTNKLGLQAAAEMTDPLAKKEGELKDGADKLATDLEKIEKNGDRLAAAADAKNPADAKPGEPNAAKPGENKPNDAKPNESKPGDSKPNDSKPGDSKPSPSKSSGSCSGSAKSAAQSMQQAQQQLGQKKPESSLKDQDQAIEKLKSTLKDLDALAEQARRELERLPFEMQTKKQDDTQHATDTLAKKMEKAEQDGEKGEGKPTPGRKSVQQAVPKQKAAAGTLKEYKPAKQKQQDAKEDLERARDELDEAINQLRQQLADEVLRALEERFTAMLAKQRELSLQTKKLDQTRGTIVTADGVVPAALAERIQTVATGEQDLEVEASDAKKLLDEDGTTAVFPPLVEELGIELHDVARRCRANETGKVVQEKQAEVEETLAMLINALRRVIEQREGGQPGQCNGQPPLVPVSAELKVLKFLQERVNKRTKEYDQGTPVALRETDEARDEAAQLSTKQARVRELTRKLANKLNQESNEGGGK
jgi:hypothetical protein